MKKKLLKVIATVIACLGVGAFVFGGCAKKGGTEGSGTQGSGTEGTGSEGSGSEGSGSEGSGSEGSGSEGSGSEGSGSEGSDSEGSGSEGSGSEGSGSEDNPSSGGDKEEDNPSTGGDKEEEKPSTGGDKEEEKPSTGDKDKDKEEEKNPVIPQPVEGGVEILTARGDLEAAYVTFKPVKNAVSYNVYCTKAGGNAVKLDAPLVREYKDYLRADAVGLAAGEYSLKVVPVDYQNNEVTASANQATMTVKAHTREGYAFVNAEAGKSASGAYNDDGTLRENARVIYVTNDNKDTVKLNIMQDKAETEFVGVQEIIGGYKKRKDNRPLAIRFIGNIEDPGNMPKGDLYVDNVINGMTIEGIGSDATFNGFGLVIKNSSYVEVRNLGFMNCDSDEGDNVGLQQDIDHIWVHNCDMFYGGPGGDSDQAKGDGALDTKKAHYITHSYNHFWDNGKCNLQGASASDTSDFITYHHNWYDHSDSRHPRIRVATVHVYNNYYDGNAKYGIGATTGASVFSESNYFRSTANMKPMMIALQGTDPLTADNPEKGTFSSENGGIIKAYGNKFDCPDGKLQFLPYNTALKDIKLDMYKTLDTTVDFDAYVVEDRNAQVPAEVTAKKGGAKYNNFDTASNFYKYSPDSADDAKTNVMKYAGRVDGGDFKFTFDNATEDQNSGVIPELKTKLLSYKDSIVKVFGIEAATGGTSGSTGSETEGGDTEGEGGTTTTTPIEGAWTFSGTGKAVTSKTTLSDPNNKITIERSDADLSYKDVSVDIAGLGKSTCAVSTDSNSKGFSIKAGASEVSIVIYLSCTDSGTEAKACDLTITGAKTSSGATAIAKTDKYVAVNVTIAAGSTCTIKASGSRLNILAIAIN